MNVKRKLIVDLIRKIPSLSLGLVLFSIAILLMLHSKVGMSPWDVFHVGIVNHTSLSLGQVSIIVGLVIIVVACLFGMIPGIATIMNMIFIGLFIDIIDKLNVISTPSAYVFRFVMLAGGILTMGFATLLYMRVNLGAGPRDMLMQGCMKYLKKPVWMIRGAIEVSVLTLGFILGGPVGIGTVIIALSIGFAVQFAFKVGRYDPSEAVHMNLLEIYRILSNKA